MKCALCRNSEATYLTIEGYFEKGKQTPICGRHKWMIRHNRAFPISLDVHYATDSSQGKPSTSEITAGIVDSGEPQKMHVGTVDSTTKVITYKPASPQRREVGSPGEGN